MSREGNDDSWDTAPRGRGANSSSRAGRRRASRRADDGARADDPYQYGSDGYGGQDDYGSYQYAGPDDHAAPNGYGRDYPADGYPAGSGYADDRYQGGDYQSAGYGRDSYREDAYSGGGYENGSYADDGYRTRGGYADDGYRDGGYADEAHGYHGQDSYPSRDPYATGDVYGSTDPFARPSGPHGVPDGRTSGPYDSPRDRGYGRSDGYGDAAAYGGQDAYGGYDDPYASPGAAYGYGEEYDERNAGYDWRDAGAAREAVDDDGPTRRRRGAAREGGLDAEDSRHDGFFRGFGGGDDDGHRVRRAPKPRRSHAGLIALTVVVVVFLGIAGVGYHFYSQYKARHASYSGPGFGSVLITVKPGDTLDSIGPELVKAQVIAAMDPWASYVQNKGGLQPGKFRLRKHMSPAAAYALLINPKSRVNSTFTIPDGMRLTDILPLMAKDSGLPLSDFQSAIKNTAALGLPAYAHGNPEGYLYPDTYDIAPGETALQMLKQAVHQFNTEAASLHLVASAEAVQFTPAQVIIGASLLEAEVGPRYFGLAARVIDNRLNQGMTLGLDATIAYVLNKHTDKLTQTDLQVNSPYNTRLHTGLPPGPIDSPDAAAIQAFLHPPHNAYLYFVTVDKNGTTLFTSNYSQFLTWSNEAKKNGV